MTSAQRKNAEARKKELNLAILRIELGRSNTKATKLSVSAVAREAGVTPALIHNHYPIIAETIRIKLAKSSRQQRDDKQDALQDALLSNKKIRQDLKDAEGRIAKLASINEMLLLEIKTLKASAVDRKVVPIR